MTPSLYDTLYEQYQPIRRVTPYGGVPAGKYLVVKRERDDRSKFVFEEFNDQEKIKVEMFNDKRFGSLYEVLAVYNLYVGKMVYMEDWD